MTQRSKHTDASKRYIEWKKDVQKLKASIPDAGATIVFNMPMPKSWSKKKKILMQGKAHEQKPDLSNLIKAFEDACRYGQEKGDQTIWHYAGLMKRWDTVGSIEVRTP